MNITYKRMIKAIMSMFFIAVVCFPIVFGLPGVTNTFSGGVSSVTLDFYEPGVQSAYIPIPLGTSILLARMNITGDNLTTFNTRYRNDFDTGINATQWIVGSGTVAASSTTWNGTGYSASVSIAGGSTMGVVRYHMIETVEEVVNISFVVRFSGAPTNAHLIYFQSDNNVTLAGPTIAFGVGNPFTVEVLNLAGSLINIGNMTINTFYNMSVEPHYNGDGLIIGASYYINDVLKGNNISLRTTSHMNPIQYMNFYLYPGQGTFLVDDVTPKSNTSVDYTHNLTVYVNNEYVYSYGTTNNSPFMNEHTINLTHINITQYPTKIDVHSNTTGRILLKDLYIEDTVRNFTFNFYDEVDGNIFDLNRTNTSTLNIYCHNQSYSYNVKSGTFKTGINCIDIKYMNMMISMNDAEYYRTLVYDTTEGTTPQKDFYLSNLYNRTVVQIILQLEDLTGGLWHGSTVYIKKPVGAKYVSIIEQVFDLDKRAYLYLERGSLYDVIIKNEQGEEWTDSFVADQAEVKTIRLPTQSAYPDDMYWNDDIRIVWSFDAINSWFNVTFVDTGGHTTYAEFQILNGSTEALIYSNGAPLNYTIPQTFYYQSSVYIHGNQSYIGVFTFNHAIMGWTTVRKTFGDYSGSIQSTGFSPSAYANIQKWFTFLFLIILILSFGQSTSHIGLAIAFVFMIIFNSIGWMNWIGNVTIIALIGVISVMNWFRREEVSVG